jgi:nucleoside-diphosphate-sugar epimerase
MILITGATGYLGKNLASALADKEDVRILTRNPKLMTEYETIVGDLRDIKDAKRAVKDVDYVFHAAVLKQHNAPQQILDEVNVRGTNNLIRASIDEGLEKITYISSVAADEKEIYTNYSLSKRRAEELTKMYWPEIEIPIIRPSGIYDKERIERWSRLAWLPFPDIDSITHLSYMDPLLEAMLNSRKKGRSKIYTVVDENWISLKEFYSSIVESSGRKPRFAPGFLYNLGLLLADLTAFPALVTGRTPITTSRHIETVLQDRAYDSRPAARELKFEPADTRTVIQRVLSSS